MWCALGMGSDVRCLNGWWNTTTCRINNWACSAECARNSCPWFNPSTRRWNPIQNWCQGDEMKLPPLWWRRCTSGPICIQRLASAAAWTRTKRAWWLPSPGGLLRNSQTLKVSRFWPLTMDRCVTRIPPCFTSMQSARSLHWWPWLVSLLQVTLIRNLMGKYPELGKVEVRSIDSFQVCSHSHDRLTRFSP